MLSLNFLQGLPCFSTRDVPGLLNPGISPAHWPTFTTVMNWLPPVQVT